MAENRQSRVDGTVESCESRVESLKDKRLKESRESGVESLRIVGSKFYVLGVALNC